MTTAASATTLTSFNPATGEPVGEVPVTPASAIPAVVARAREAQAAWGAMTGAQRADILRPAGQKLLDRADELGRLMTARAGQADRRRRQRGHPLRLQAAHRGRRDRRGRRPARTRPPRALITTLRYDPLGVVAAITPWNFPMLMPQWMVLPALVAGNSVVLKPSEQTPLIAQAYADALNEFLPEGVLQTVHGADDQGKALVASDVNLIAFTGSKATGPEDHGRRRRRAQTPHPRTGQQGPAHRARGRRPRRRRRVRRPQLFRNCGQVCVSTERIYAEKSIADAFAEQARRGREGLPLGRPDRRGRARPHGHARAEGPRR
jgi:acyl-CoA reductase-like NAD-dependent aldehyde dehydrogenase